MQLLGAGRVDGDVRVHCVHHDQNHGDPRADEGQRRGDAEGGLPHEARRVRHATVAPAAVTRGRAAADAAAGAAGGPAAAAAVLAVEVEPAHLLVARTPADSPARLGGAGVAAAGPRLARLPPPCQVHPPLAPAAAAVARAGQVHSRRPVPVLHLHVHHAALVLPGVGAHCARKRQLRLLGLPGQLPQLLARHLRHGGQQPEALPPDGRHEPGRADRRQRKREHRCRDQSRRHGREPRLHALRELSGARSLRAVQRQRGEVDVGDDGQEAGRGQDRRRGRRGNLPQMENVELYQI
mmetsp:Transcript_17355/g.65688  ORF Transcript_17355/g.65688 Transcript_17355/m.65688 type:complete len:295 (-) Transcript_17355:2560-3444(-)